MVGMCSFVLGESFFLSYMCVREIFFILYIDKFLKMEVIDIGEFNVYWTFRVGKLYL